ncbi:hypothetical protein N7451_004898 [Penicillium sp. IBT 35674x]|nr:hypothetical protein N7451_004898 [Penicillium sp. IBT 35674x]
MSGDLIDADETTIGSRAGGTGYDDVDEGTFYKMAGCALCGNRQGRCRHLAINASDTAENPATLQAK